MPKARSAPVTAGWSFKDKGLEPQLRAEISRVGDPGHRGLCSNNSPAESNIQFLDLILGVLWE